MREYVFACLCHKFGPLWKVGHMGSVGDYQIIKVRAEGPNKKSFIGAKMK